MTRVIWDAAGERYYEAGVDRGVLYIPDAGGAYSNGYAWNGLTSVNEAPSGAESNPQYADNIKYLDLVSAEEFGATIEAFTYPDEFGQCDGTAVVNGVTLGQQRRKSFGLSYRTLIGNDLDGTSHGYKIHLVYGALAAPSEKSYGTINDSPEAITFSWEVTTTPVSVGEINGNDYSPTSILTIPSTTNSSAAMTALENILYGTPGADPRLPLPAEVISLMSASQTSVTPTQPTFAAATGVITFPVQTGVVWYVNGIKQETATYTIATPATTVMAEARPLPAYKFPEFADTDWSFTRT